MSGIFFSTHNREESTNTKIISYHLSGTVFLLGIVLFLNMIFIQYSPELCDIVSITVNLHFIDEKAYLSLRDAL